MPDQPSAPTTLGELLGALTALVEIVVAPAGLDVPVRAPVITAPGDRPEVGPGDVALVVGLDPLRPGAGDVVRALAARGAAAIVVASAEDLPTLVTSAAEVAGVAVLRVAPHVDWGQLFLLARTASTTSTSHGEGSLRQVPLGDLFALANAIAAVVGGATTIEDRHLRVLAHSSLDQPVDDIRRDSILGRRVPAYLDDVQRYYRVVQRSTDVVVLRGDPGAGIRARMGVAVRAGTEVVGTIWVVEGDESFTSAACSALQEAATIATLHLLRHDLGADVERRRRGDLVRGALDGQLPVGAATAALGFDADEEVTVVVFCIADDAAIDDAASAMHLERVADLVALNCEAFHRRSATVALGRVVYAVLPERPGSSPSRRRELVRDVVARADHALKAEVMAAIGSTGNDLAASRRDADAALRVVRTGRASGPTVHIDDVRHQVLIDRLCDLVAGHADLASGIVSILEAHDREHGSEYLTTVQTYLAHFGNVVSAAEHLGVHPNTLRHRLRRMREVVGLDLDDPDVRFVVELELRLGRFTSPEQRARSGDLPCG